jgi:hypothetical protein
LPPHARRILSLKSRIAAPAARWGYTGASSWRTPRSQPTWPCGGGAFWCGPPILRSPIGWRAGRPREFLPTPRPLQAANRGVCGGAASAAPRIRSEGGAQSFPTTWPAGRAAVRFNYVLRPAGFIGHCNVRSSLNVAGEFRTSKKRCLRFGYGRQRSLMRGLVFRSSASPTGRCTVNQFGYLPPKWGRPRPSAQLSCHRGGGCTLPRVRLGPAGHVGGALFPLEHQLLGCNRQPIIGAR